MSEELRLLAIEAARRGAAVCLRHWGERWMSRPRVPPAMW